VIDANALEGHRRVLWAFAYRMTGVAADADDVVQETFVRALRSPPRGPLRPWLLRVGINLCRDLLRRRRRTAYEGPWLPSPVEDEDLAWPDPAPSTAARYELAESASFAFLIALERLTPLRRAVLILRDVFDYSGEETADALSLSVDNVKQALVRARRDMAAYDATREPLAVRTRRAEGALRRFVAALAAGDVAGIEALLATDVVAYSDGGGDYLAARVPIEGAARVATVYANLRRIGTEATSAQALRVNGQPAVLFHVVSALPGAAPRILLRVETDTTGVITAIHSVLSRRKLQRLAARTAAD
jgi:RNA polymerase sigma-70 factor (ECF subfamily)